MNRRNFLAKLSLIPFIGFIASKLVKEDKTKPNPYYSGLDTANGDSVTVWKINPEYEKATHSIKWYTMDWKGQCDEHHNPNNS